MVTKKMKTFLRGAPTATNIADTTITTAGPGDAEKNASVTAKSNSETVNADATRDYCTVNYPIMPKKTSLNLS